MSEEELYQQYLQETQQSKPNEQELYQQYLKETGNAPQAQENKTSAGESFIQNAANAITFGYLPQIQAVTEPAIQGAVDMLLPSDPAGFEVEEGQKPSYVQRRDQYLKNQQTMQEEHPDASLAGTATGAIVGGIATGGGLGKILGAGAKMIPGVRATQAAQALATGTRAATMAGRAGQAGAIGGLIGLIRNPGDIEGEVSPLQIPERASNVGADALTGVLFQGGTEVLGKVGGALKNSAKAAREFAETRALKATGAMKPDLKLLRKLGIKGDVGRAALEEGIVKAGDSVSDVAEKVVSKKNNVGDKIGKIYKTANDELKNNPHLDSEIDLHKVLDDFESDLVAKYKGKAGGKKVVASIVDRLDDLRDNPEKIELEDLFSIRQDVDREAKKLKAWGVNQETDVASELKNLRNKLQDAGSSKIAEVDQSLGTNFVKELGQENKRYSNLKQIEKITKDGLSREESNRIYGLSEQLATMGGTVAKGPVVGIGMGIGSRLVKKYGDATAASVADSVYKTLNNNPRALGVFADPLLKAASISPQRFSFAINNMIKKPEFKKKLEELQIQEMNTMPALGAENKPNGREPSGGR